MEIDETLPKKLYGDAGKIRQVLLNLLTNAVKYTERGGIVLKLTVTGRTEETCSLRFSVKDTGIGVKEEDMEKLFTAYERLDEERNSGIQGTGLGLDISRRFSELMGGKLWCESVYGEGSEFILTLEQKIVDPEGIGEFHEEEERAVKGPYMPQFTAPEGRVLVVDDSPMNLTVITGLLKATRMQVTTAESGEECLELLKKEHFHVVLLDHMMPGMDGIETVGHIRESDPDLPVYALTANSTAGGDSFYRSKGFNGYLSKPIDSTVLEKAIMEHLPEEILQKPTESDAVSEPEELPEEFLWIQETEGISLEEGIRNSGGISSFIFSLKLFYDTIEDNAAVIEKAWREDDIRFFTVKVHALKTSARIVGARELSRQAEALEEAGNHEDREAILAGTEQLLELYRSYETRLRRLEEPAGEEEKESVDPQELKEAYEALREIIPGMDYDGVEMILKELAAYRLPAEDARRVKQLEKLLKALDWDGMEALIG